MIVNTCIRKEEISPITKQLKDIIFVNGGKNFLFSNRNSNNNNKTELSCENFIILFKEKTDYDYNTLKNVFYFIVKNDREFTFNDYLLYFDDDKKLLNDNYFFFT
jgi:hypothetical protein